MEIDKELSRLNIAKQDIGKAIEFLESAQNHEATSLEYEALIMIAIIHYARPFSINEKSPTANALASVPPAVTEVYTPDEVRLHHRLINRRNKAIAHAEWNEFPVKIDRQANFMRSSRYSVYPEFLDSTPLIALLRKLHTHLFNMVIDRVCKVPRK